MKYTWKEHLIYMIIVLMGLFLLISIGIVIVTFLVKYMLWLINLV